MIEEVKIEEIVFTNEYIDMVDLQVEDNENFILENGFLTHNSGKSYLIRAMMDRMRHIGFDVIYLSDVKDEMKSSIKPVQEKFQNGLLPGEKPKGTKVVTLRPTFFKQISDNLNELNFWYSIDINKLTRADFMTLMNVHEMTPNQRTAMDLIFQELQNRFKSDPDLKFSVDLIYNIIDTDEDIDERQKQGLRFKFKPLEYAHFWIEEYQRSIVDLINRGFIPAINMENFDSFGKGNFLFPEVTLNIILREVIEARRAEQINKIWVVIDEASRFVGKTKNTSIKTTVEESYELDSRYGVWYCLEENTEIKIIGGSKKIKDLDENNDKVMSYNFKNNKWELSKFKKIKTGKKKMLKIKLGHKEIQCSEEHILFVKDINGKIVERKAIDLKIGDELLESTHMMGIFNHTFGKKFSKETRKKISKFALTRIGEKNPNYNKRWSLKKRKLLSNYWKNIIRRKFLCYKQEKLLQ